MSERSPRRKLRIAFWLSSATFVFLAMGTYWIWNARQRPTKISGAWLLDDLRTEGDDASLVTLHTSGFFDGEPDFGSRWRYRDGRLYFRTWQIDRQSPIKKTLQDTTLYSWFTETQEFSLEVAMSEDGKEMTLSADGEGPRCRLRRVEP